ncbi:MAG TPA: NAD-binding protein, partial [Lysobacter sp.]
KVFVVAIDGVEESLRTGETMRRMYPDATIFARARDRRHAWELMDLGARAIRETFYSSLKMGEKVLVELGIAEDVARSHAEQFRDHDLRLLHAQSLIRDDEDALLQSTQDARRELEELFNADSGTGVLNEIADATRKDMASVDEEE